MAALLMRIERASKGEVKICRTAADIRHCIDTGKLAAILHIEGAEGIDPDLYMLDVLYESGLRSIGPVWSRPNIFGHGVPFRYPVDAGHGSRPDRPRRRAGARLQPPQDHARPLAPEREGFLGRGDGSPMRRSSRPIRTRRRSARIRATSPTGSLPRSARAAAWWA